MNSARGRVKLSNFFFVCLFIFFFIMNIFQHYRALFASTSHCRRMHEALLGLVESAKADRALSTGGRAAPRLTSVCKHKTLYRQTIGVYTGRFTFGRANLPSTEITDKSTELCAAGRLKFIYVENGSPENLCRRPERNVSAVRSPNIAK